MSEHNKLVSAFVIGAGIGFFVGLNLKDYIDTKLQSVHHNCNQHTHNQYIDQLPKYNTKKYISRPTWSLESDPDTDDENTDIFEEKEPLYSKIISDKTPQDYFPVQQVQQIKEIKPTSKKLLDREEITEIMSIVVDNEKIDHNPQSEDNVQPITLNFALHPEQYEPSGFLNYSIWRANPIPTLNLQFNNDYNPNTPELN